MTCEEDEMSNADAVGAAPTVSVAASLTRTEAPTQFNALALYPDQPPEADTECWNILMGQSLVRNVSHPTITPFLPDPQVATGAAVIVAPGGGFKMLSMENEGWPVAEALAKRGIAAFVLKYRLNETPDSDAGFAAEMMALMAKAGDQDSDIALTEPRATEDGLAALEFVRSRAEQWNLDPARVGLLGFSAGAITALNVSVDPSAAIPPAFLGYVYGPMHNVEVPSGAPPMFAALAIDDPLFGRQGFGIIDAWREAGMPVELHAYEKGGHGFGLGHPGTTTTGLLDQFVAWLDARGLLKATS